MKKALFVLLALLLPACSRSRSMEDVRAQLEHQQSKLADIERSLINAKQQELKNRIAAPAAPAANSDDTVKTIDRLQSSLARVESQLTALDQRLATLEQARVAEVTATPAPALGKILPSKPIPVSIYSAPDNRVADFIETPTGDNADLFPVRITSVAGRRTVSGTHMTTRIVDSSEGSKDEYGRIVAPRKEIQEPVNEYAYEVVFSAQNLTRTEKTLSATAGGATRTLMLKPGETDADISLRSALGSDLHVEIGGMVRNFRVSY